jgi:streptomycin 6-kinase
MRKDGSPCVLKVARAVEDTRSEIAALRLWNGRGAARLLASDAARAGMLLERVAPGTMLAEVAERDDDAATRIAAGLLRELWQPAEAADGLQCEVSQPTEAADGLQCEVSQPTVAGDGLQCEVWQPAATADGLQPLEMWCAAYDRNRAALLAGVAGFPRALFERADALRADLLSSTQEPVVLHGDLHHFNVLRSERAGWLAIDPKGLLGDRCFDVCQFLLNPDVVAPEVNSRRLDIFCAELGLDPRRTREWCIVHAVLNACWAYEDGDPTGLVTRVAYAEQALRF